ncbi:YveK family protein [Paucisalibacillus globulus]|uniref:YveK family protein n=1 Tax=Paucisalibacillus globulus TaxID=351095 RepID=UPI0003F66954|nr:Wzz/FepE/Etk N-terminal domain-containing protein [Paucisalibacillus globulus]
MKDTLSIHEIIQTLKKRTALIILLTISFIILAAILSYYVLTPTYQSTSQFIVIQQTNENIQFNIQEIESNLELINTYKEIIKSPSILEQVANEMNLGVTLAELGKQIKVSSGENSQVITVSAVASSPEKAAELANLVVETFENTILPIMKIESVYILSNANPSLSHEPISPRPIVNMILAAVIGLTTGIGLALSLEFLNTKVKSESDIEEQGIPVLGVVSNVEQRKRKENRNTHMETEG